MEGERRVPGAMMRLQRHVDDFTPSTYELVAQVD